MNSFIGIGNLHFISSFFTFVVSCCVNICSLFVHPTEADIRALGSIHLHVYSVSYVVLYYIKLRKLIWYISCVFNFLFPRMSDTKYKEQYGHGVKLSNYTNRLKSVTHSIRASNVRGFGLAVWWKRGLWYGFH